MLINVCLLEALKYLFECLLIRRSRISTTANNNFNCDEQKVVFLSYFIFNDEECIRVIKNRISMNLSIEFFLKKIISK